MLLFLSSCAGLSKYMRPAQSYLSPTVSGFRQDPDEDSTTTTLDLSGSAEFKTSAINIDGVWNPNNATDYAAYLTTIDFYSSEPVGD